MSVVPFSAQRIQSGQARMQIQAKTKIGAVGFEALPGESILYAGLRSGIPLPYECATGTCGTCKARRSSGDITQLWPEAPGARYLKAERNEFLMCQAAAGSSCQIEIPAVVDTARPPVHRPVYGQAEVTRIERLTHDVAAVHIETDRVLSFQAGQFIAIRSSAIAGYRAYSMVNFSAATPTLEFVIKRKPGGRFCDWIFGDAAPGAKLDWFGPLGKATFDPAEQRTIVAIAGGSGIASIMSILSLGRQARHFEHFDGAVFFGVRGNNDVFYADRLSDFVETSGKSLQVVVALSHEEPSEELRRRHPFLQFEYGFVHEIAGRMMTGRTAGRVAYLAGPPPMVDAAIRMLILQARLPASDVRYDKFG